MALLALTLTLTLILTAPLGLAGVLARLALRVLSFSLRLSLTRFLPGAGGLTCSLILCPVLALPLSRGLPLSGELPFCLLLTLARSLAR